MGDFFLSVTVVEPKEVAPKDVISVLPCNYNWQLKRCLTILKILFSIHTHSPLLSFSLRGRWKGDQIAKVSPANNQQLAANPQFSLKIEVPCSVVIIVVR
jgi:hypothetical protein